MLSFQRKSEHHVAIAKKNPQKQTSEVWKLQGLCLWHMLKANLFEMFPRNWVLYVTTLCTRRTRLHYVIFTEMTLYIMLISCWLDKLLNVETCP